MKTMAAVVALAACTTHDKEMPMKMQAHIAGEGRALALVGGGLTGWQSWIPLQERLATTRRVARIQPLAVQLGLERRPLPPGYSVDLEADALGSTLADLSSEPIDLVAWSYGAAIALDFALDHPERIRTLTLIEPPAVWVLDETGTMDAEAARGVEEMRALYATMTEDVTEAQLAAFVAQAGLVPPGKRAEELPPWPNWVEHRRSLRTGGAAFDHRDRAARLRAFDRPVLLVTGRGTAHMLRRVIDGLAATLPRVEVVELEGGHAPQIVDADRFVAALTAFVTR